jgi:lipopolysaccharide/colanic/teichoic acid biosynthesis glycosyltransferase
LAGETHPIGGFTYLVKRLIDIAGSAIGLVLTGVLTPVLAIMIKIDSPGPIVFRQRRVGQGGRAFMMYKFRTMENNAEARLGELLDLQELDSPAFKLIDDPRITRTGRFLRRWSLDELPQFWNVLRGDMSLVGPRPEEEQIVALYGDWHRQRLEAKPGMTGPMQIRGRANLSLDDRVRLEIDYIQEYTLWRDMKILSRTIPSLMKGEGAR